MSEITLVATARTEFGKGAARRIRRADQVPAVLYGHGASPLHIALPGHATMLALKQSNVLLEIKLDDTSRLAVAKDVQRDPVKNVIEHVDLLEVKRGEKIEVEVTVHVVGEPEPGMISVVETQTLTILAEATNLPEYLEASVEGLGNGDVVRASDIKLPEGSSYSGDPETAIVIVELPRVSAEDEAADEAAADEAAASDEA